MLIERRQFMDNEMSVVTIPDLFSVGRKNILTNSLFFNHIYTEGFYPNFQVQEPPEHSEVGFFVTFESYLEKLKGFDLLLEQEMIIPIQMKDMINFKPISFRELPKSLIKLLVTSLKKTPTLSAYSFVRNWNINNNNSLDLSKPYSHDDLPYQSALLLQLTTIMTMLSICSTKNVYPLISNHLNMQLFISLTKHIPEFKNIFNFYTSDILKVKKDLLTYKVVDEILPKLEFKNPKDILLFKEDMKDELETFQVEMSRMATFIEKNPWNIEFEIELQKIVDAEIKPAFNDLKCRMRYPSKRMIKCLVNDWKSIVSSTSIPITAIILKNASLPMAILTGLAAGLSTAYLKAKVEEWDIRKESKLFFLLETERRSTGF